MHKLLLIITGCLISFSVFSAPNTIMPQSDDPQQIAALIKAKASDIKAQVLQQLQNTPSHTLNTIAQEPSQTTLTTFPIETPAITAGPIEPEKRDLPSLPQPIFIIGSDDLSKQWLISHLTELKTIKAVGFLVQAKNQNDFELMKKLAEGLVIIPLSGTQIAKQYHLYHYPILLLQHEIKQ